MIKLRSPQIRISFQRAADKTALLAFALGLALSLAAPGAGAKDREDEGKHDRGHHHELLKCDDTMKDEFRPDSLTEVLLVKAFKKGDALTLTPPPAPPAPQPPVAGNDVCVVKLLVGPGNPGPAGAPSTSPGIGIEIWLPARENWNHRIHVAGGGGWAGGNQTNLIVLAGAGGVRTMTASASFHATLAG